MERIIFHIDVNSAYLSWSASNQKTEPDLRTIPSIVGGDSESRHGIVLAKSVPAKQYGILTGEPIASALRKCPHLVCIPPDFPLYAKCSKSLFALLSDYSDRIEQYSIDEGFLDYTGMEKLFGPPLQAAACIQKRIHEELGFTVNIGISRNKFLAKMAGELEKPNKLNTLFPEEIEQKLWCLPVEEMFMVGRRTAPRLHQMGIHTIGDLAHFPLPYLEKSLKSYGKMLHAYANGLDDSPVIPKANAEELKSIGNSTTTPHDVTDRETAYKILLSLAETVSMRLRGHHLYANEIAVTIKSADFKVYSHQKQVANPIDCTNAVFETAKEIFDAVWRKEPLRLLGIRAGKLCDETCTQLSFFDTDWSKQRKADIAMDTIRLKYGKDMVRRSTFTAEEQALTGNLKIKKDILR